MLSSLYVLPCEVHSVALVSEGRTKAWWVLGPKKAVCIASLHEPAGRQEGCGMGLVPPFWVAVDCLTVEIVMHLPCGLVVLLSLRNA